MDLYRIISDLVAERDRVVRIIESLEAMEATATTVPARHAPRKRGRKYMDSAARKEVSERMKRYWAKRRREGEPSRADFGG